MYNMSFVENQTGIYEFFVGMNRELDYMIFSMLLITIFLILVMSLKNYDTKLVLLVSATVTVIIAGLGLATDFYVLRLFWYPLILWIASVLMYVFGGD